MNLGEQLGVDHLRRRSLLRGFMPREHRKNLVAPQSDRPSLQQRLQRVVKPCLPIDERPIAVERERLEVGELHNECSSAVSMSVSMVTIRKVRMPVPQPPVLMLMTVRFA